MTIHLAQGSEPSPCPAPGDRSHFSEQFAAIRQAAPDSTRFVLVTATVPEATFRHLSETEFPGMKVAFGPRLHRPSSGGHAPAACTGGMPCSVAGIIFW